MCIYFYLSIYLSVCLSVRLSRIRIRSVRAKCHLPTPPVIDRSIGSLYIPIYILYSIAFHSKRSFMELSARRRGSRTKCPSRFISFFFLRSFRLHFFRHRHTKTSPIRQSERVNGILGHLFPANSQFPLCQSGRKYNGKKIL